MTKVMCPSCYWEGHRKYGIGLIGGYGVCMKCFTSALVPATPERPTAVPPPDHGAGQFPSEP